MPLPRRVTKLAARLKPLIPDDAWPLINTVTSLPGRGPIVGTPSARRVLALAAHPDDESSGCAGLLAHLAASGAQVTLVFATDGERTWGTTLEPAEVGRRRRAEAGESARLLGLTAPRFLGLPDGELPAHLPALTAQVAELLHETAPQLVLTPWFLDGHRDHQAVSSAVSQALAQPPTAATADTEIWGYETWTALPANRIVDVTTVMDRKQASMAAHRTALQTFDVTAALGLSRWRSMHGLHGRGYAEAFLALPAAEYRDLATRVRAA